MPTLMILSYTVSLKPTGDYTNETAAVSSNQSCILGRQQLEKVKTRTSHLNVGESRISRTQVKNLGSWFDCNLGMLSHVNSICTS